jgi:hypothetical protein
MEKCHEQNKSFPDSVEIRTVTPSALGCEECLKTGARRGAPA